MARPKPTVFIGSAEESLPVLDVVKRLLKPVAHVIPWTDQHEFRQIGDYFLDSLIDASERFDFAVLIFGPHDVLVTRKEVHKAPRDNVIFELGLFLPRLRRERTFVIAPTVWKTGLKILSDLEGLGLAEYEPPRRKKDLEASLKKICKDIAQKIRKEGLYQEPRGPKGVTAVPQALEELIATARADVEPVKIRNIALDMEATWPLVHDMLLSRENIENITWLSLMIDTQSKKIQKVSSDTVSVSKARKVEKEIKKFCEQNQTTLKQRKIRFECRAYDEIPTLHGFLFNDDVVLLSLCAIRNNKLFGMPNPYLRLSRPGHPLRDEAALHFIEAFESWFEHRWRSARQVWPA